MERSSRDETNGAYMHVDETPVRATRQSAKEGGIKTFEHSTNSAYMRTYSNPTTTVLTPNAHKDIHSVPKDGILTRYCGVLCHDHEAKFYRYGDARATCGAYPLRELTGLVELYKQKWADDVRQFFQAMCKQKQQDIRNGDACCDVFALRGYAQTYDLLVG